MFEKLGIPSTRISPANEVEIEEILGMEIEAIEQLFLEFLEMLNQAKWHYHQPHRYAK